MAEIRQKIISCDKGHYYDANRYSQCPYCNPDLFSPPPRTPSPAGRTVWIPPPTWRAVLLAA